MVKYKIPNFTWNNNKLLLHFEQLSAVITYCIKVYTKHIYNVTPSKLYENNDLICFRGSFRVVKLALIEHTHDHHDGRYFFVWKWLHEACVFYIDYFPIIKRFCTRSMHAIESSVQSSHICVACAHYVITLVRELERASNTKHVATIITLHLLNVHSKTTFNFIVSPKPSSNTQVFNLNKYFNIFNC